MAITRTLSITGQAAFTIKWWAEATTFDPSIFGFIWSQTGAFSSPNYVASNDYTWANHGPHKELFATSDGVFDLDLNNVTLPDASLVTTDDSWSGVWHNGRHYGSNREKAYVLRGQVLYQQPGNDEVKVWHASGTASTYVLHTQAGTGTYAQLDATTRYLRLGLTSTAAGYLSMQDAITINMVRENSEYGARINMYYEVPSKGHRLLLHTFQWEDIDHTTPADVTVNTSNIREGDNIPFVADTVAEHYLLLEYVPDVEGIEGQPWFRITASAATDDICAIDSNGEFAAAANSWTGSCQCTSVNYTGKPYCNLRFALENAEGYETELGTIWGFTLSVSGDKVTIVYPYLPPGALDFKYLNVYRTLSSAATPAITDPYFLLCQIPREFIPESGRMTLYTSGNDNWIVTISEADIANIRNADVAYADAVWWDERLWGTWIDYPDTLIDSEPNQPEYFNLSDSFIKIGLDGRRITGKVAMSNRLMVFKENSFFSVYPVGDGGYGVDSTNDDGIGTKSHRSIVADFGAKGSLAYFQGQDGHFHVTDGVNRNSISDSRLDVFVRSLNKDALDKTRAVFNDLTSEVMWAVCTGGNTTPDTLVIYNTIFNSWTICDMPAVDLAKDTINTSYEGIPSIIGVQGSNIFLFDKLAADLGNSIDLDIQTGDMYVNETDAGTNNADMIALWITGYSALDSQTVTVSWYVDKSDTAKGSATLTLTAEPTEQRIGIGGRGETLSLRFTNEDSYGFVRISRIVVEVQPHKSSMR